MDESEFSEKFIVFFDVLGWKHHVTTSNQGRGLSIQELEEVIAALGSDEDRKHFEKYGPTICPEAPRIRNDLDFRITVASDCAIVSAEISPSGLINLVSHCWTACLKLLTKGMMCRGYIKRGRIHHTDKHQFGTGLNEVIDGEKNVSIFRQDADDRGTPFIEVDKEVIRYVEEQQDKCVKEMFSRMVKVEGDLAAIFPFERLNHSFMIGGFGVEFDPEKERTSLNNVRGWIHNMKDEVTRHIDSSDASVVRKGDHYIRLLDAQLVACDRTEEMIEMLCQPFPARQLGDITKKT
ncbi:MAG: hypothetical protein RIA64_08765 [Rhodospirillales bacterium]